MYDLSGEDTGREWIEVENSGEAVTFSDLKFFENGTNHGLTLYSGADSVSGGQCAVISSNPDKFKTDNPSFSGNLFKASFSLSNVGESLAIKSGEDVLDSASYSSEEGANGDGNSLHRNGTGFFAAAASPGTCDGSLTFDANKTGSPPPAKETSGSGTSSSAQTNTSTQNTSAQTQSAGSSSSEFPVEPQIFTYIKAPEGGLVGADVIFRGTTIGLNKKPISNARFIWNFGDGATKEGPVVSHSWRQPGTYIVFLSSASSEWSATARAEITIVPSDIEITDFTPGPEGFTEIVNKTDVEVDLGGWVISSEGTSFILPENTLIEGGASLPIPNQLTKIAAGRISLLYPSGREEYYYDASQVKISQPAEAPMPTPSVDQAPAPELKYTKAAAGGSQSASQTKDEDPSNSTLEASSTVVYTAAAHEGGSNYSDWLLALGGMIGIGILAAFSYNRRPQLAASGPGGSKPLTAEDFKIMEVKDGEDD